MRIHLSAESDAAVTIGGVLASLGHEVTADVGIPRLRLILPAGWLSVAIPGTQRPDAVDLLLRDGPAGDCAEVTPRRAALLRSGDTWEMDAGEGAWVALFDLLAEGSGQLELVEGSAALVVPQDPELRRLLTPMAKLGVRVELSRSTGGHAASLAALRLLDLPLALCNTTREVFLAAEQGRRIAEAVLDEGVRLAEKLWGPLERIAPCDPRDLLQEIKRRPVGLSALRQLPGRRFPHLLGTLLRGGEAGDAASQRSMVRRARALAMPADWNWRVLQMLPRVARAGFFASPADLLRAMG